MQAQAPVATAQTPRRSNSSSNSNSIRKKSNRDDNGGLVSNPPASSSSGPSATTTTNSTNTPSSSSTATSTTTNTSLSSNLNNASTLFGSTIPRSHRTAPPRRPGTSSGPAASSAGGTGAFPSFGEVPFAELESARRAAFNFGLSGNNGQETGGVNDTSGVLRKSPFGRKPSLGDFTPYSQQQQQQQEQKQSGRFRTLRRRANSSTDLRNRDGIWAALGFGKSSHNSNNNSSNTSSTSNISNPLAPPITDNRNPPALPTYALSFAAKPNWNSTNNTTSTNGSSRGPADSADRSSISPRTRPPSGPQSQSSIVMDSTGAYVQTSGRMLTRTGTMPATAGYPVTTSGMMGMPPPSTMAMQGEAAMVHQHIQEMANKRISTLEYLRKAHEGRVYWFNTLLFDKPDLARMPYFDTRRLARRATNYLLLGLSLPAVIDLNSNTPVEFLRSLNLLLTEFDSFQSLHPETGGPGSGLTRARIPNLNVFRRATPSAKARRSSSATNEILYEGANEGAGNMMNGTNGGSIGGGSISGASTGGASGLGNGLGGSASVVSFGQNEADLMPGEEYVHLLTPSLPFDPDFFETFATLCDVLIDAYTRLLGLLSTPRECTATVAELFTKADARVRKIIVQGVVKEFEDTSRNGVRTEVANVGKIVLSGLM